MSEHRATIVWERGEQEFVDGTYSRAHAWTFDGGATVPASASPAIVPTPMSIAENVDPEEAFIAALASCHMLFFLSLAARRRFVVDSYSDAATGYMGTNERGATFVARVVLEPKVAFSGDNMPTAAEIGKMHRQAHGLCFLANSVRSEIVIRSSI